MKINLNLQSTSATLALRVGQIIADMRTVLKDRFPPSGPAVVVAKGKATAFKDNSGLWRSDTAKATTYNVTVMVSPASDDDATDPANRDYCPIWVLVSGYDPNKVGLIYTDKTFLRDIRALMDAAKVPGAQKAQYSEQGMQGDNYVSMDGSKQTARWLMDTYGEKLFVNVSKKRSKR